MENSYKIKNVYGSDRKSSITFRATERYKKKISAICKNYQERKEQNFFVK